MAGFVRLLGWFCVIGLLLGLTGNLLDIGVSASVIRPQLATVAILLSLPLFLLRFPRSSAISLVAGALGLAAVVPGYFRDSPPCEGTCFSFYQKNLLSRAWPRYELADDIIGSGAEFVTLQEVSDHNLRFMKDLFDHYPNKVFCELRPGYTVAAMTSLDVVPGSELCVEELGLAAMNTILPGGETVWLVATHLRWPFPYRQAEQLERALAVIGTLTGPVLLGGDLNAVAWSAPVRKIESSTGTRRVGPYLNTYARYRPPLFLPIDHVFIPIGWSGSTELRPTIGSDHFGLLARIGPPPPRG